MVACVDNKKLLNAVFVEKTLRLSERCPDRHSDQIVTSHNVADLGLSCLLNKTDVPIGQNADQLFTIDHRQARDAEIMHKVQRLLHGVVGLDSDRIEDHTAFALLHLFNFMALVFNAHVFVDNANPTHACHGNRHGRFCHCVHRGRQERKTQRNGRRERCREINCIRSDFRIGWDEEDVVKSKCFAMVLKHCLVLDVRMFS